ncbi:hypothetical protein [Micromonospora sp. NPDC005206]|uniref:hypothetical protein n=1 Tax=Micromonospora sp. NPDC005206 TaxID=3157022 RepID=UPI0033AC87AA
MFEAKIGHLRRSAVLVCAVVLTGCSSSTAEHPAAPVMSSAVASATPASPQPSAIAPVPQPSAITPTTAWDRLWAGGEPHDKLSAKDAGLPDAYLPDRGEDAYDRPRQRRVRRDMAAFLLRVRAEDPQLADQLGWQLQAVPPAWCSIVLPSRTPQQLAAQVADANARGQELARRLGVKWAPPVDRRKQRLLTFARDEAGRRFCLRQAASPGRRIPDGVSTAARLPGGGDGVNVLDTALPIYYSAGFGIGVGTHSVGGDDLRLAYVGILVGSAQLKQRNWPTALDCDVVEDLLRPAEVIEYASRLREGMQAGWTTKPEAVEAATRFASGGFDLMETRLRCRE